MRTRSQLLATGGNGFRLFQPFFGFPICHRLPPVATAGLHEGSILRCLSWLRAQPLHGDAAFTCERRRAGSRRILGIHRRHERVRARAREDANLRPGIRSPPLGPLSYGRARVVARQGVKSVDGRTWAPLSPLVHTPPDLFDRRVGRARVQRRYGERSVTPQVRRRGARPRGARAPAADA